MRPNECSDLGRRLRSWLLIAVISSSWLLTGGCARFSRDWKQAGQRPVPDESLAGAWEGRWVSEKSGHEGNLRAVIEPVKDNDYKARFKATYAKVFKFKHSVLLETTRANGQFRFTGDANLGWWAGGRYEYDGKASVTNFYSKYRSKGDHGYFIMERPD